MTTTDTPSTPSTLMLTPTQEALINRFEYLPSLGRLAMKGTAKPLGTLHRSSGGRRIQYGTKAYPEDRLVWCYHHGVYPEGPVKHLNGNKLDCNIDNLAYDATQAKFRGGRKPLSGIKGIQLIDELDGSTTARVNVFVKTKTYFGGLYKMHDLDLAILRRDTLRFEMQTVEFNKRFASEASRDEFNYCLSDDYSSPGEVVSVVGDNGGVMLINKPLTLPLIRLCLIRARGELKRASDLYFQALERVDNPALTADKLMTNLSVSDHNHYYSTEMKAIVDTIIDKWE